MYIYVYIYKHWILPYNALLGAIYVPLFNEVIMRLH